MHGLRFLLILHLLSNRIAAIVLRVLLILLRNARESEEIVNGDAVLDHQLSRRMHPCCRIS